MNSTLATEPTEAAAAKPQKAAQGLETWAENERMRHIPPLEWMIQKVDTDLRARIGKAVAVFSALASDHPRRPEFDNELKALCRSLDRLAEVARHARRNGQNGDVRQRLESSLADAAASLRSLDANLIGRRFPFHTFERSRAEPLYGALLVVINTVDRTLAIARNIDADFDERLLQGTVVLQNPVDERMLRPIA